MAAVFFYQILMTIVSGLYGFAFYQVLPGRSRKPAHPVFYLLSGLLAIAFVNQVIILFFPLGTWARLIQLLVLIVFVLFRKKALVHTLKELKERALQVSRWQYLAFLAAWLLLLAVSAGPPQMDDTESYHIQMVKWISSYGSVPGLANLHFRYGFNSAWFVNIAFFRVAFSAINDYTLLNAAGSVWLLSYLLLDRNQPGKPDPFRLAKLGLAVFGMAIWVLLRGNAVSANYDFITAFMTLVLFLEAFRLPDEDFRVEWLCWPAYLFTVRIINFPLLLLSLSVLLFAIRNRKLVLSLPEVLICSVGILAFLARNVVLTGYLFFPSGVFNLFPVDWKVNLASLEEISRTIKYFNRVSTQFLPLTKTENFAGLNWVPHWFHYMYAYNKMILLPGLGGLVAVQFFLWRKAIRFRQSQFSILALVILVQLVSWFLIAPDPRFIYGFLLLGVFFLFWRASDLPRFSFVSQRSERMLVILLAVAMCLFAIVNVNRAIRTSALLTTVKMPQPTLTTHSFGNFNGYIPDKISNNWNPRCYDSPLPCFYEIEPGLKARGSEIADGFRIVENEPSVKK